MPRCCATINDPTDPSVLVYVEVDRDDQQKGKDTATAAAQAAFAVAQPAAAVPAVAYKTKNGHIPKDAGKKIDNALP
jgi:hypothetical protein